MALRLLCALAVCVALAPEAVVGESAGVLPGSDLISVVEKWRQLPDGKIEFAVRHFSAAD